MQFRGDFKFLSNFHNSVIVLNGKEYPTAEHAFQSCRAAKAEDAEKIRLATNPVEAKKLGKEVRQRSNWNQINLDVMRKVVEAKFTQHLDLAKKLKAVQGEIIEENYWRDTFWGTFEGKGENNLGKILTQIRQTLVILPTDEDEQQELTALTSDTPPAPEDECPF
jgi:ribA/ribD-fused uncharacterized protein